MKDGRPNETGDAERRRPPGSGRRGSGLVKQHGFVERAMSRGHSGHGVESVRPYLRDTLRLKALLPTPFPTPEPDPVKEKDDHHR
jgi:hypothetical protein